MAVSEIHGQIRWQTGLADRSGKTPEEMIDTIMAISQRSDGGHFTIQFDTLIAALRRAALAEAGVVLLNYLGDHAYFAVVAPANGNRAALSAIPSITDAQEIQSAWKLHPVLHRGEKPYWAVVPLPPSKAALPGAANQTWFGAYLLFHPDVTDASGGLGGVFQGNGSDCLTAVCPMLPGACCYQDGSCTNEMDTAACTALGGVFQGSGTDCLTVSCPVFPGACCYPDGSCTNEADAAACAALGGVFQDHGINCQAVVCEVAADVDCNGVLDMNDTAALVDVLLGMDTDFCHVAAADMTGDGSTDGEDIPLFVAVMVGL